MNSIESELLGRSVNGLMCSLTKRCLSLQHAHFLDLQLQASLRQLMRAHGDNYSSLQYIQGLHCLTLLELQRLYAAFASLYYQQAHRHNLRIKYLTDSNWRRSTSPDIRSRIWEEFWEFALAGTDPEDHYVDDPTEYLDEDEEDFEQQQSLGGSEEEKIQVFVEWDQGCRGD